MLTITKTKYDEVVDRCFFCGVPEEYNGVGVELTDPEGDPVHLGPLCRECWPPIMECADQRDRRAQFIEQAKSGIVYLEHEIVRRRMAIEDVESGQVVIPDICLPDLV